MIIKYSATLKSPAMTGKDGIIGKDLDIITKLDNNGLPYFSASQIKGILREKTELFSNALDSNFPVNKYFGEEGKAASGMRFTSLTVDPLKYSEYKEFLTDDRYGIRIDRASKTTAEGSLFSYEFVRNGIEFNGEIEIFEEMKMEELKLLKASLERIDTIGGLKSRGLGKVEVKIKEVVQSKNQGKKKLSTANFKSYRYTLKALENMILKNQEIGNEITTNNYIHGGTVRGAIITHLDREYQFDMDTVLENLTTTQALPKECFIAPMSVFESKYPVKNGKKVRVNKLLSKNFKDVVDGKEVKFERYGSPIVDRNYEKVTLNKQTEINIAIDSESKASEEGKIFNKEILLAKDIEFSGEIRLTQDMTEAVSGKCIYLGKGKSKGFGKCLITLDELKLSEEKVDLKKLETLSKEIGTDKKYFTIDFYSDMILPFIDTTDIGDQIKKLLSLDSVEWEEGKSFINIISIGGYSQLNKMRKSTEFAIAKGGVLTFSAVNFSDELIKKLDAAQKKGLGARKTEGFGKIEISSKKHLEVK